MITKELAARRLSGALGRKVSVDDVTFVDDVLVQLEDGSVFALGPANGAYIGDGVWYRNGRRVADPLM